MRTYATALAATLAFIWAFYAACDRIPAGAALNPDPDHAVRP